MKNKVTCNESQSEREGEAADSSTKSRGGIGQQSLLRPGSGFMGTCGGCGCFDKTPYEWTITRLRKSLTPSKRTYMKAATLHFVVGRALTYYDSVADPANAMKKEWMDFYFEWNKLINVFAIGMLVIDFVWLIINGVDWIWSGQPEENPLLQGYQSVPPSRTESAQLVLDFARTAVDVSGNIAQTPTFGHQAGHPQGQGEAQSQGSRMSNNRARRVFGVTEEEDSPRVSNRRNTGPGRVFGITEEEETRELRERIESLDL